ncbi:hypothetical protein CONCODRAFT_6501 [Conidiobolus coronatus NRRL 28638]|uniref:C2 domain-containing protein n=1 Tax=Conidiobolus coronatus (strain ATCC 28846 / CBS 209.66 / NRRL 28638) TaxID=796925 RepID=A0A137P789_CONC2|nr:hypothetical protein CONCODRAFT_6501 [Conidiobolus coronatus NRRL 28638]|eukprot:KXN70876.1 hypothetical protein CONCODRAFT_6501 [Conidiobolus coronatus NRRL 28638]
MICLLYLGSGRNLANNEGPLVKGDLCAISKTDGYINLSTHIKKAMKGNWDFYAIDFLDTVTKEDINVEVWKTDKVNDLYIGKCEIPFNSVYQQGKIYSWYTISDSANINHGEVYLKTKTV